jgi:hypothetical protein
MRIRLTPAALTSGLKRNVLAGPIEVSSLGFKFCVAVLTKVASGLFGKSAVTDGTAPVPDSEDDKWNGTVKNTHGEYLKNPGNAPLG